MGAKHTPESGTGSSASYFVREGEFKDGTASDTAESCGEREGRGSDHAEDDEELVSSSPAACGVSIAESGSRRRPLWKGKKYVR
jgi:hypothetical protein